VFQTLLALKCFQRFNRYKRTVQLICLSVTQAQMQPYNLWLTIKGGFKYCFGQRRLINKQTE